MLTTAHENIEKTHLGKAVIVVEGDGLKVIFTLEGDFDFAFMGAVTSFFEPSARAGSNINPTSGMAASSFSNVR